MTTRYSWIVKRFSNPPIQIDADYCLLEEGTISFYKEGSGDSGYLIHSCAAGTWEYATIMSQLTGEENGYRFLEKKRND